MPRSTLFRPIFRWPGPMALAFGLGLLDPALAAPPAGSNPTVPGKGVDIGAAGSSVLSPIGPLTATAGSASVQAQAPTIRSRARPAISRPDAAQGQAQSPATDVAEACGSGPLDWTGARRLLVSHGPALALSRARIRAAQADLVTAGERPNPTLSFGTAHYSPRNGVGAGRLEDKALDSVLRIDQIVERGDKRHLRQDQAQKALDAARLQAIDDRRTQELALFDAYADLRLAEMTLANARDQAALLNESLDVASQRFQAGHMTRADLLRHRIEALRGATESSRAEAGVATARVAIVALLGCPGSRVEVSSRGLDLPMNAPAPENAHDIEARPDVRAADARTQAAKANVELTRANLARDVDLGVQYENDPGPNGSGRTIGFGIAVPLFLGNRFEGEIARAEADRLNAADTAYSTRAQAAGEIATARTQLVAALERARRARGELLPEATAAAQEAEQSYRQGKMPLTDLIEARRTLRTLQLEVNGTDDEALRARAAWDAARGLAPLGLAPLPNLDDIEMATPTPELD